MACMENVCTNSRCGWGQFSNEMPKTCPLCGGKVINFWDEQIDHDREMAEAKYGHDEDEEESE